MANLIIGIAFLTIALFAGLGVWLVNGSGALRSDPAPMTAEWDIRTPEDDGVTTVTLGGGSASGARSEPFTGSGEDSPFGDPLDRGPGPQPHSQPFHETSPRTFETYIVRSGDTLSEIAQRQLGTSRSWRTLLQFNERILSGPEDLRPGQKLRIPTWLRNR